LFAIYYLASLFVFIYKAFVGEVLLIILAAMLIFINFTKKYWLLHLVNVVTFAVFLSYYAGVINVFGIVCAIGFLGLTTLIAFLTARLSGEVKVLR